MASELKLQVFMKLVNGNLKYDIPLQTLLVDQASKLLYSTVWTVASSGEESKTAFDDVATEGWCYYCNLDAANYVDLGFSTGVYGIRAKAGEFGLFRLKPGADLFALANTAPVNLQLLVLAA